MALSSRTGVVRSRPSTGTTTKSGYSPHWATPSAPWPTRCIPLRRRNDTPCLMQCALKAARAGHWQYDVERDLFTFNDQFYSVFGTTAEKIGYTMTSAEYASRFVHPEDVAGKQSKRRLIRPTQ